MIDIALALLFGLAAGAAANWAADVLPVAAERMPGRPGVLHYLTFPWYLFRRGACPHCGERRPLRAPLLELAMIAVFALVAWRFGSSPAGAGPLRMILYWLYAWFLLTVLVIDFEHRLVLNMMTGPAALLALAASFLPWPPSPAEALLGGGVAFVGFLIIALIGRGAMGMGDVKLAGVIGLMLGYPLVVPALLSGIILGGLAALLLLITKRVTRKTTIAYAPYLCLGALAVLMLAK